MHRLVNTLSLFLLIIVWWQAAGSYRTLPGRIPIHFNILGRPDGWGPRWMIWFLPTLATIISGFWAFGLTSLDQPRKLTAAMQLPFSLLLLAVLGGFAFINRRMVSCARGEAAGLSIAFLPIFLSVIFGISAWLTRLGYRQ